MTGKPASVLIIGSGPVVIGQAAEFDYAGVQACLALRGEGVETILVNSNPATVMTDPRVRERLATLYRTQRSKLNADQMRTWTALSASLGRDVRLPDSDRIWMANAERLSRCETIEGSDELVVP